MKILVTGSSGFVGSETVRQLQAMGIAVVEYDLMRGQDVRDLVQLEACVAVERPDKILHLAAIARFSDADADPQQAFETNVLGTKFVSYVANKYHCGLVYSSTGSVYMPINEKPPITEKFAAKGNSVYGCTKYAGETYVRDMKLAPWIILRYAHLYGKEKRMHGLIGGFTDRIKRGLAPTLYGGKQSNDFTYIKDVARANVLALTAPWDKWNQIYNIGTGEELTAKRAGEIICKATGWKGKIEVKEQRTVDPDRFVYDVSKAEVMLGFKAVYDFEKGLKDMFAEAVPSSLLEENNDDSANGDRVAAHSRR